VAQLRGMLELVDNIMDNLESTTSIASTATQQPFEFVQAAEILEILEAEFDASEFPADRRRLVDTLAQWMKALEWGAGDLRGAIDRSSEKDLGKNSLSLTDRLLVMILLSEDGPHLIGRFAGKFLISRELETFFPIVRLVSADKRVVIDNSFGQE
jgi:hypothetical protein